MATVPHIGAHVSIAGGIQYAPERAHALGCETFQIFTRSPQGGPAPELTAETVAQFRSAMETYGMERFVVHAPYYINLASAKPQVRHSSVRVLREELERASTLGASYVMAHPGSHAGQTYEQALERVTKAVARILDGYVGSCGFLLEIAAGTGSIMGDTFQEVADMMAQATALSGFAGVCFDTCHAFASGYDFTTPEAAEAMLQEFDDAIGLEWLKVTHVNDSKVACGERKDRHEHIGRGRIGIGGLTALLTTPAFAKIDWILETEDAGRKGDVAALRRIRQKL